MMALIGLTILVVHILSVGFVGASLWRWFLVPIGLPQITAVHALGVTVCWAFLQRVEISQLHRLTKALVKNGSKEEQLEADVAHMLNGFIATWMLYGTAAIVAWIMN